MASAWKLIWLSLGFASLAIGIIGVFLPLIPTVPFLLLAAACFAKGSARLHAWLLNHQTLGPPIKDWQEGGAISTRAKRLATLSILATFSISIFLDVKPFVLTLQAVALSPVMAFIWTRPGR